MVRPHSEQVEETWQGHRQKAGRWSEADAQSWQKVWGALRVGQVALGMNTQEPGSGWQREDGQQVGGALGRPASLAGSPDPGSEDCDLIPYPTRWCS